ncbi:GNAT family N-acetyltransferase [Micromonospora aurantiaca (nom. illeg.)]|uniref:GNAT family N-acetyltransferase n=1 Tax=Micromonospora aurantiaca (nom. illeg.) TaxID=47850 RepID=UPI003656083B
MRPRVTVRRAIPDDLDPLLFVLAEAFLQTATAGWLVPNDSDRRRVCYRYFRLVLQHALRHGTVETNADLSAVAVWYGRGEVPPTVEPDYQDALEQAAGEYAPKFNLLDAMFEAHHPRIPHDCLTHLAVDPLRQNRGLGTALLRHALRRLDAANRAAYVVACNERSRDLYLRLGYRQGPALHLPSGGPMAWRMWRGQPDGGVRSTVLPAQPALPSRSTSST